MAKKLNDLAKIGLGLAAAYGASKVLGQKSPMEIARLEGEEAPLNQMEGPAKQEIPSRISDAKRMANQAAQEDASRAAFAKNAPTKSDTSYNTKNGIYGEPGSVEGFIASEEARRAKIEALRGNASDRKTALEASDEKIRAYNRSLTGAKKGKMIKASKGGEVLARGNKLARSRPTKLY